MSTASSHRGRRDLRLVSHVRRLTIGVVLEELRRRLWSEKTCFGLRAALDALPERRPAKIELTMEPCVESAAIASLKDELQHARGADYGRVLTRKGAVEAGVSTIYAARNENGEPAYVQWLVTAKEQDRFHAHALDRWPSLEQDEVFLEFAYTFVRYRRMGAMSDGMAQLLRIGRDDGASAAITYVRSDNVASLRGCANVGFDLDHVRHVKLRFGRRFTVVRPVDLRSLEVWRQATKPRSAQVPAVTSPEPGARAVPGVQPAD